MVERRCAVADVTRVVGDRWALLIMREALYGRTRFDEFEKGLGVASNVLSARLRSLVEYGLLERRTNTAGRRHTYHLSEKGKAFFPVYVALKSWADQWSPEVEGAVTRLCDAKTGKEIRAAPLVRADGSEIVCEDMVIRDQRPQCDA